MLETTKFVVTQHALERYRERVQSNGTIEALTRSIKIAEPTSQKLRAKIHRYVAQGAPVRLLANRNRLTRTFFLINHREGAVFVVTPDDVGLFVIKTVLAKKDVEERHAELFPPEPVYSSPRKIGPVPPEYQCLST